jgi:hypothetical protein
VLVWADQPTIAPMYSTGAATPAVIVGLVSIARPADDGATWDL